MVTPTATSPHDPDNRPTQPAPKRRIVAKVLALLALVIGILCAFIATRPAEFRVSRSATMSAAPAAVFAQINDFHNWKAWSPWEKMDPNAKATFEGPTAGVGSTFHWDGNADVGAGSMTITESEPSDHIKLKLNFLKPMAGTADTLFTFKPEGDGTAVTWTMTGENGFVGKAVSLVMDCDKMVGPSFEQGLASIKQIVEAKPVQ